MFKDKSRLLLDTSNELRLLLGTSENAKDLILLFERTYLEHENLADATRYLVNELFGEYGLIILDGDDKKLKKQIMKIQTQSLSVEEPKNPDQCNVFKLFKIIGSDEETEKLRTRYTNGGMGYGEAKELLYNQTLNRFSKNRELFFELTANRDRVEQLLLEGASKARKQAQKVLKRVRTRVGF